MVAITERARRGGRFIHQLEVEITTMIIELGKLTEETKKTGGTPDAGLGFE